MFNSLINLLMCPCNPDITKETQCKALLQANVIPIGYLPAYMLPKEHEILTMVPNITGIIIGMPIPENLIPN